MYSPIYAAVFALFFIGLSVRVIWLRRRFQVPVGHGDHETLLRAMRIQGNFAEYVPFALLLIFMLEFQGISPLLIHVLCVVLLVGRISHAFGVRSVEEDYRFRVAGMTLTFLVMAGSAVGLFVVNFVN